MDRAVAVGHGPGAPRELAHAFADDDAVGLGDDAGRLVELRLYHSIWALTGEHVHRPPLLQDDPDLVLDGPVGAYVQALTDGDVDAAVALFEPDGDVREPAGGRYVHRGPEALHRFFWRWFADGPVALERCALAEAGACRALEYNIVGRAGHEPAPEAGVAVFDAGDSGRLAHLRLYDDAPWSAWEPAA